MRCRLGVGRRSDHYGLTRGKCTVRLISAAIVWLLLPLSVVAVPLVGQEPMGRSGFRLGVATEYVVAKGIPHEALKNGVGIRLHTDFRLSTVWTFQISFIGGRYTGLAYGGDCYFITGAGECVEVPDVRFSSYSVTVGPRVRKGVVNDRFGVIAGVDLGVSQFGEMSHVSRAYVAGVVVGGETRLFQNFWLTLEAAADVARVSYTRFMPGYGDGRLFSLQVGCAVPF